MLGQSVPRGAIFYGEPRRRLEVAILTPTPRPDGNACSRDAPPLSVL
jgi:hypothetical protein